MINYKSQKLNSIGTRTKYVSTGIHYKAIFIINKLLLVGELIPRDRNIKGYPQGLEIQQGLGMKPYVCDEHIRYKDNGKY